MVYSGPEDGVLLQNLNDYPEARIAGWSDWGLALRRPLLALKSLDADVTAS